MTVYYLIPMFNEQDNLLKLQHKLLSSLPDQNKFFVFSDDCSTDNSVSMVKKLFPADRLHVVEKDRNAGPGHSFNLGFEWILNHSQNDKDIVVTMEADGTSDINILQDMVAVSNMGYDLVLASIYAQGGGFSQTSFIRKLLSFGANMMFRVIFDIKVLTLSSFYRVYHISLLKKIKANYIDIISEPGFICMLELLLKSISNNARVVEIPMILDTNARVGKSKMKILKTTGTYVRFLMTFKKHKTKAL
jgi:dolichol-phosphate mannosyltransferase